MSSPTTSSYGKEYDICVITAANDYQALGYQKQLQWRKDKGKYSEFFVFADPQGKRIGSGGSTIYVLYGIRNYFCENNHENYQSPHEPFKGKRILILHSGGDSRRLPAYSAVGKIFIPLPTSPALRDPENRGLSMDGFVTLFDILFLNLMQLPSLDDGQVVVASGDVLLSNYEINSLSFLTQRRQDAKSLRIFLCVGEIQLEGENILTGIPKGTGDIKLRKGICVACVPVNKCERLANEGYYTRCGCGHALASAYPYNT